MPGTRRGPWRMCRLGRKDGAVDDNNVVADLKRSESLR